MRAPNEPGEQPPCAGGRDYGDGVGHPLVTALVPLLPEPTAPEFNLFRVLHHGTNEKQISNLFAWLLDPDGTHELGETFQRIFIDQINRSRPGTEAVDSSPYSVRQEVNTSPVDASPDIADLVLESEGTVIVVENFHVSDGHGHDYWRYRDYGARDGKDSVVVMLCGTFTPGGLTDGWENAAVVTYTSVLGPLTTHVLADQAYMDAYPQQCFFLKQMHVHFVKGRHVSNTELINFVSAVCESGDAGYYRQSPDLSAVNFADMLRERALDQFTNSRDLLGRVKTDLLAYANGTLMSQVNDALGTELLTHATANYRGIYQWTVNLHSSPDTGDNDPPLQIKFGPSAWFAVEEDADWEHASTTKSDYTHLFLTERVTKSVVASMATMEDVLAGIAPDDHRLRDELLALVKR